jgi:dihydropteroate synthase
MPELMIRNHRFNWGTRTYLMGILNVTPDSFSDGGQFNQLDKAVNHGLMMVKQGADMIDIGGQSTRPGAKQITLEEELERVIPVVESLRQQSSIPISVDTTRREVARAAIAVGADLINDISGATFEPEILQLVAENQLPIILMHIRGNPETMQSLTDYQDLIPEICQFFQEQINQAREWGVKRSQIILDPGIGFAKNYQQNIDILKNIQQIKKLGFPILIGTSRKSLIGQILNQENPQKRVWGTAATCCHAISQGVDILRVHDISEMADVIKVADVLYR